MELKILLSFVWFKTYLIAIDLAPSFVNMYAFLKNVILGTPCKVFHSISGYGVIHFVVYNFDFLIVQVCCWHTGQKSALFKYQILKK